MTSWSSPSALRVEFQPSLLAGLWFTLLVLLAGLSVVVLPWPVFVKALLLVGLVLWWGGNVWRRALGRGGRAVEALCWESGWLLRRGGAWYRAELRSVTVWPQVCTLLFSLEGGERCRLWLPPDCAVADDLRRLRVVLRHAPVWRSHSKAPGPLD